MHEGTLSQLLMQVWHALEVPELPPLLLLDAPRLVHSPSVASWHTES
jgi:hypothetical protein